MIRFSCPACSTVISAPIRKSGTVDPCPNCAQLVQVPPPDEAAYADLEQRKAKKRREGMRAFLALFRFFLWSTCFAAVALAVVNFFMEYGRYDDPPAKTAFALQMIVFVAGFYFVARTFDLATKSLEELCARFRGKRR